MAFCPELGGFHRIPPQIESKIVLGEGTILSNCHIIDSALEIPGEFMFHTVPLNVVGIAEEEEERGRRKYVTVAFGIRDDLKATVSDPANLRLGDRTLASRGVPTALNFTDESGKAAFSQKKIHKLLLP